MVAGRIERDGAPRRPTTDVRRPVLQRDSHTCREPRLRVEWRKSRYRRCEGVWRNGGRWGERRIGGDPWRRRRCHHRLGWSPFLRGRRARKRGGRGCNPGSRERNARFATRGLRACRRWSCWVRGNRPKRCASLPGRGWDRRGSAGAGGRRGAPGGGGGAGGVWGGGAFG